MDSHLPLSIVGIEWWSRLDPKPWCRKKDSIYRCAEKKASHTQDVKHGHIYIYIYIVYCVYCIYINNIRYLAFKMSGSTRWAAETFGGRNMWGINAAAVHFLWLRPKLGGVLKTGVPQNHRFQKQSGLIWDDLGYHPFLDISFWV